MGNPLFSGMKAPRNPIQNMMQMRQQMNRLKQNPSEVADFLKQSGRITEEQYQQIKGMNGSFQQIGQYLMGTAPQNMYGQIEQNVNAVKEQM